MNKLRAKVCTAVFFAAVIAVSVTAMLRRNSESTETANTVESTDEYPTDTAVGTDGAETMPPYAHDIDPEFMSYISSINAAKPAEIPGDTVSAETEDTAVTEGTSPPKVSETAPVTSRTVITSRQRKEYDSNSVYIDMENILQNPELPVGCEITALTTLLRFYGFNAEKTDMARNYLPTSWGNARYEDGKTYKDSFYDYFIGDPFSKGYGCFSPAVEKAANSYISSHGGGVTVKNISGCHPDTLYEYLIAGTPVLCWATDGMIEPEFYETWYDNATGEQLDWYLNEHCFVLAGFNISANTVTLNDPMKGIIDYNIDKFEIRFKQMHSQAIVLIPDSGGVSVTEAVTAVPESVSEYEETTAGSEAFTGEYPQTESETVTFTETIFQTEPVTEIISPWDIIPETSSTAFPETVGTEYSDISELYTE
ncbi:MAG: C39 family peptidase [Ruminococcus sp.]|nr:C39 family peptidase [Ruminococcus sp.]